MKNRSPEVDAYIEKAAPFARPILKKIREAFHDAHPDVQEAMKWSAPHFEYKGLLGSMAAFKQHVSWGFWKAKLMDRAFREKVSDVSDLPNDADLVKAVRKAIRLNEEGAKVEKKPARRAAAVDVPDDLRAALAKNRKARDAFERFSPSHQREYVEWITEAKQQATRERRLATTLEWLAEGKPRNWKYVK